MSIPTFVLFVSSVVRCLFHRESFPCELTLSARDPPVYCSRF
jgi:hypothetical protein